MKLVSIIMPIFNAEYFLEDCLESIRTQTYPRIEIILIDDGSTDNSTEIARQFTKEHFHTKLIHQENKGPSAARNRGLKEAAGTFIQFVDADDLLENNAVTSLVKGMEADVDLVICGFTTEKQKYTVPITTGYYSKEQFMHYFGKLYKATILSSPCNKMYRSDKIMKHNIQFDVKTAYGEDLLFNLRYLANTKTVYILEEVLYQYHKHANSLTSIYIPDLFTKQKKLHQEILTFLKELKFDSLENLHALYTVFAEQTVFAATNLFSKQNSLPKSSELRFILNDPEVQHLQAYFDDNYQAKLVRYFIRNKAYRYK